MLKRLLFSLALLTTACVADSPLVVTNFHPVENNCALITETIQSGGQLDLSATGAFQIRADLKNFLDPTINTTVEGKVLETGEHRNKILIDTTVLTYTTDGLTIPEDAQPQAFMIEAGFGIKKGLNLMSEQALIYLNADFNPDGGIAKGADGGFKKRLVKVTVRFDGKISSGARISSNPVTFPITVFQSGFNPNCQPDGFARNGPCGGFGGQDGIPLCCVPDGGQPGMPGGPTLNECPVIPK